MVPGSASGGSVRSRLNCVRASVDLLVLVRDAAQQRGRSERARWHHRRPRGVREAEQSLSRESRRPLPGAPAELSPPVSVVQGERGRRPMLARVRPSRWTFIGPRRRIRLRRSQVEDARVRRLALGRGSTLEGTVAGSFAKGRGAVAPMEPVLLFGPQRKIVRIRDLLPNDAEKLVAFRQALFGETDFLLYGPGEYSMTVEEV